MNSKLLLLDGATGTELNRRGVDTGLPLWSANALTTNAGLSVLRQVHLDYLNAGADIITTNTFRTNRRALAQWHSLWFVCRFLRGSLFLFLVFVFHELCGFLSSWVSLAFVAATGAIGKLVFGCDLQSVGVT